MVVVLLESEQRSCLGAQIGEAGWGERGSGGGKKQGRGG